MCVDIRLRTNPNLDVVLKNAVKCPSSYTEESVMEVAYTDCLVSIYHEVSGVIRNSFTDGVFAFSERDSYGEGRILCWKQEVFICSCVKEAKITLPTCSAEDYSETADKRARLSLEVQVTFVRPRGTFQWFPIPGCNFKNRKIKRPVQTSHLPRIFSDVRPIRSHDDSNYALYSTGVSALDCCWT